LIPTARFIIIGRNTMKEGTNSQGVRNIVVLSGTTPAPAEFGPGETASFSVEVPGPDGGTLLVPVTVEGEGLQRAAHMVDSGCRVFLQGSLAHDGSVVAKELILLGAHRAVAAT